MIFQMGTLESTKDRSWTWILAAPMKTVQKAGVDFDPDTRSITAIQGDAASGSALEVIIIHASIVSLVSVPSEARDNFQPTSQIARAV